MSGPDHYYVFHVAILRTNRQNFNEARQILWQENVFVRLVSRSVDLGTDFPIIAADGDVFDYTGVSMDIDLDTVGSNSRSWYHTSLQESRVYVEASEKASSLTYEYIFSADDLDLFCTILLEDLFCWDNSLVDTFLVISVSPKICKGLTRRLDSFATGQKRVSQLLEPFRLLHSLSHAFVRVRGAISARYKAEIKASICKKQPLATDVIASVSAMEVQGEEAQSKDKTSLALSLYRSGLYSLRCTFMDHEIVTAGPLSGMLFRKVREDTAIRAPRSYCSNLFEARET